MKIEVFKESKKTNRKKILIFAIIINTFLLFGLFSIYFSKKLTNELLGCFIFSILATFAPFLIDISGNFSDQYSYVYLNESYCNSFNSNNELLCKVDLTKNVYFCFFQFRLRYKGIIKFIAISNEKFEFNGVIGTFTKKGFLGSYNKRKVIVFPRTYESDKYFDFSKCTEITKNTINDSNPLEK